jgi:hypothetical protein
VVDDFARTPPRHLNHTTRWASASRLNARGAVPGSSRGRERDGRLFPEPGAFPAVADRMYNRRRKRWGPLNATVLWPMTPRVRTPRGVDLPCRTRRCLRNK